MKSPLYLIDGYALIFRAYFALIRSPLLNSKGFNVSAIHGFARIILNILNEYSPEYLAVSLDSRTPTFRDKMYPEYKQTRQKTPDDLRAQFPIIEDFLARFHLPTVRHNGVEADDIIATLARRSEQAGQECYIVSGDKDLYQLVGNGIYILKPSRSGGFERLDSEGVLAEKGVRPNQILDYLSLLGDTADNVPGVRGIGQKTAEKLLVQFDSLDNIYANLSSVENAKLREKLKLGRENAFLSRKLITLKDDLELSFSTEELNLSSLDGNKASKLCEELEMKTLSTDLRKIQGAEPGAHSPFFGMEPIAGPEVDPGGGDYTIDSMPNSVSEAIHKGLALGKLEQNYELVTTAEALQTWVEACQTAGKYAFDTETDSLDPQKARLCGFSLSHKSGKACYVPLRSTEEDTHLSEADALAILEPLLSNPKYRLIGQNIKYDYKIMAMRNINLANPWFDTLIAGWLLNTNHSSYSLDGLAEQYLGYTTQQLAPLYEEVTGQKLVKSKNESLNFAAIPLDKALFYAAEDADITFRLHEVFELALEERRTDSGGNQLDLFFELEMPIIPILSAMELKGIKLRASELESYSLELEKELEKIQQDIFSICGHEFNIASTKQLQIVLFEERKLKTGKKTKTGFSTDTSVLEELASEDPVPALVLRYRILAKLKSTYVDALPILINEQTGRVHSLFQQNGTATGRISSHDPNLQNIPIRDEEGRRIREAFVPQDGHVFVSADYSQIELVVLAHLSGDKALQEAFKHGSDIHAQTASRIFQIPIDEVDASQRRIAKTINFGVVYGMGAFRLSNELEISRKEAQQFIDSYFDTYSKVKGFMEDIVKEAEKRGYVETMLGRRREIAGINSNNRHEKNAAERVAINTPIQGSAADIVKTAMMKIDASLKSGKYASTLLLQVHDELIFEVPLQEVEQIQELLRSIMPNAIKLSVPLRVNIEVGRSWGEMH